MFPNSANVKFSLLSIVNKSDALGIRCPTVLSSHEVVGTLSSITRSEYQTSVMMDVSVYLKVKIHSFLYKNEKFCLLSDDIYKIERAYVNGMFIELYLSKSELKKEELTWQLP